MSKIEVLITTMNQKGFDLYNKMNLQTDAVIANQADRNEYHEAEIRGCRVKLITTDSRGVSRNRNLAMAHSGQLSEYILFSDDDLVFVEGYEQMIMEVFFAHPEADAIKFNIHDLSESRKIAMRRIEHFEKATRRNMSSSGVWGLVMKVDCIKKHNLKFHEFFGPGTELYCGEDTIFLMDILSKKVRLYRSPVDIAGIDQSKSSWYEGHNERFFVTAGAVLGLLYPRLSHFLVVRSAIKAYLRKDSHLSFFAILKCYYKGINQAL